MSDKRSLSLVSVLSLSLLMTFTLWGLIRSPLVTAAPNAIITVTNTNDSGAGSLRQAIIDATAGDIINFDSALNGQTILLSSELSIDKSLTISGSVPITVSGNNANRVFNVIAGNVTFDTLNIADGNAPMGDCGGGGIAGQNNSVTITVTNSTIADNSAECGGGLYNFNGVLIVNNTALTNNSASFGGGIATFGGTVVINNSTVSGNSASDYGGGVYNDLGGIVRIVRSTISDNSATYGGGANNNTLMTVHNSTISGNSASNLGGGISNLRGTLAVNNSTIVHNSVGTSGGGISSADPEPTLTSITNTIVVNNVLTGTTIADDVALTNGMTDTFASGGYNLIGAVGTNVTAFNQPGDQTGVTNPLLGPLSDNGGDTFTHALQPGSPAVDAGNCNNGPATDQRGVPRPQDNTCDSGAFEVAETLTVAFEGTGNGSVSSQPIGIDCKTECMASFPAGTIVTLTATADTGSSFVGWTGTVSSTANPITLTMETAQAVTATFDLNSFIMTVGTDGAGAGMVNSTPAGINCGADCAESFDYGTVVTLTATADTGSSFAGWSGTVSGAANPVTLTVEAAQAVTATFSLNSYTLTVSTTGAGAGMVSSIPAAIDCGTVCDTSFDYGTIITLTATADTGSTFTGWSGTASGSANPITLTMDTAQFITATFSLNSYTLTVNTSGTGEGMVSSIPTGINCGADCEQPFNYGTAVTLTATAEANSSFAGWSGAVSDTINPITLTVDAATNVTATFTLDPYTTYLPVITKP